MNNNNNNNNNNNVICTDCGYDADTTANNCSECSDLICDDCIRSCDECGSILCESHAYYQNEQTLCGNHALRCDCGSIPIETSECNICDCVLCERCRRSSDFTSDWVCRSCEQNLIDEYENEEKENDYNIYSFADYSLDPVIAEYHSLSLPYVYKKQNYEKNSNIRYLGIELELWQNDQNPDKPSFLRLPQDYGLKNLYKFENDGSVDIELITCPLSLDYHKKTIKWRNFLKKLSNLGYTSYNPSDSEDKGSKSAGIHIHVTRSRKSNSVSNYLNLENKLYGFFAENREILFDFSKRRSDYQKSYAKIPYISYKDRSNRSILNSEYRALGRYSAVNVTSNTIEFRLFRGTLNFSRFMACLEFSDAIVSFAETHSFLACVNKGSWLAFQNFLLKQKQYNHLIHYFKTNNLWRSGFKYLDAIEASNEEWRSQPKTPRNKSIITGEYRE